MKTFEIIKLKDDFQYEYLIILCDANSPYDYIDKISGELAIGNEKRKILIDQMLHVGNSQKRYIEFDYFKGRMSNGKFVKIKKDSVYRKLTCEYLKDNIILKGTILTSIQQKMIQKGINI